jgi:hypothetical protein
MSFVLQRRPAYTTTSTALVGLEDEHSVFGHGTLFEGTTVQGEDENENDDDEKKRRRGRIPTCCSSSSIPSHVLQWQWQWQ